MNEKCAPKVTPWTPCTAYCGMGLSHRETNFHGVCETSTEARICQERICPDKEYFAPIPKYEIFENDIMEEPVDTHRLRVSFRRF